MQRLRRRPFLLGSGAVIASSLLTATARAQGYPNRPITLVLPWPAAGATDLTMRVLADIAGRHLGQPIVIENRPGASGTLVVTALRNAQPDGYTIGQLPITLYRFVFQQKVTWNPLRDIQPVLQISGYTFGVVVPTDSPFATLADLVAWAKANPGTLSVGSTGIGTTAHLAMEDLMRQAGATYIHVPYKGTADQMLAVANQSLMAGVNSSGFAPYVDTGKLRLLAIFSEHRSKRWPGVPTVRELGYKHAVHTSPYGIGVPKGTDPDIVRRLHDAFKIAMFDPRHLSEIGKYDQVPEYLGTADYDRFLRENSERERAMVERLGLTRQEQ